MDFSQTYIKNMNNIEINDIYIYNEFRKRRKKSDFDDNSWIIQKVIEQWNAHAIYKDVYKMVNQS